MEFNIIEIIKQHLGTELVTKVASRFGESESGISKAISGLIPAILSAFSNNSSNSTLVDAIKNISHSDLLSDLLENTTLESAKHSPVINSVLDNVFGDKLPGVINSVSQFAGVSAETTNALTHTVTGATLGTLGNIAADHQLDASGISGLLSGLKDKVSGLLPAGLSLTTLGLGSWLSSEKSIEAPEPTPLIPPVQRPVEHTIPKPPTHILEKKPEKKGSVWSWLIPVLILIALFFLWKQCGKKSDKVTLTDTVVQTEVDTLNHSVITTRVDEDIDLNGTMLKGYHDGMEAKMIQFLKTDGYKNAANDEVLKDTWYDFDHVNFKFNSSSELEEGSEGQLNNLVAILKAYPDVRVKIGGYTDRVGDEKANKDVSQKRADFIKKYLTDKGVGAQVAGAEGYGSQFATQPETATDEERAVDRKMSVRFTK